MLWTSSVAISGFCEATIRYDGQHVRTSKQTDAVTMKTKRKGRYLDSEREGVSFSVRARMHDPSYCKEIAFHAPE